MRLGMPDAEAVEGCGLRGIKLRDAAQTDFAVCGGGQDDVVLLDTC